jgi:hypothetical protein
MPNDRYSYVASDYHATGEGRTLCLLITLALPNPEDYEQAPEWYKSDGNDWVYNEGFIKNGSGFRALREFGLKFGEYYSRGALVMCRESFMHDYAAFVPDMIKTAIQDAEVPGNLFWSQQLHINYS